MADFIKTIANSTNLFGGAPSTKWGQANFPYTMTWGTTKWGQGSFSIVFEIDKYIANSLVPDSAVTKEVERTISETITPAGAMSSEILTNGVWRVVFVSDTINVEDRDMASWTCAPGASTSFTCLAAGSTTWT